MVKLKREDTRLIKMTDFLGMVPEELCTTDREGGADDFFGCGRCFEGHGDDVADCENCVVNTIFQEYSKLTGQSVGDGANAQNVCLDSEGTVEGTKVSLTGVQLAEIACMQIRYKKMQNLLEQAAEEIENFYCGETDLSERIRTELT